LIGEFEVDKNFKPRKLVNPIRLFYNSIILTAQKNTSYNIKVSTEENSNYAYFLYVTGSTEYLNKYNISGWLHGDHTKRGG